MGRRRVQMFGRGCSFGLGKLLERQFGHRVNPHLNFLTLISHKGTIGNNGPVVNRSFFRKLLTRVTQRSIMGNK